MFKQQFAFMTKSLGKVIMLGFRLKRFSKKKKKLRHTKGKYFSEKVENEIAKKNSDNKKFWKTIKPFVFFNEGRSANIIMLAEKNEIVRKDKNNSKYHE